MGPLLYANWRLIHDRFCLLLWAVATGLAVLIVVHFAAAPAACASPAGPHARECASHLAGSRPFVR